MVEKNEILAKIEELINLLNSPLDAAEIRNGWDPELQNKWKNYYCQLLEYIKSGESLSAKPEYTNSLARTFDCSGIMEGKLLEKAFHIQCQLRDLEKKEKCAKHEFINFCIAVLLAFGTIHLEMLAYSAILDRFSWCGTPRLYRKSVADIYFVLFVPLAITMLILRRKKTSTADALVRISGLVFFSTVAIYWFFEEICRLQWLAAKWW